MTAIEVWLLHAELMLSVNQPDGTRHSLPLEDPRMANACPVWQERLHEYERQEDARRAAAEAR